MNPIDMRQLSDDYLRIEQAIRFIEENYKRQPDLKEIASSVHLSEYHFQRLFTRWAGISPKRFVQFLSKESAKRLLADSASVLEAAYQTGLSSPGRLHDLFIKYEAVTPGEFKLQGMGLKIRYGYHSSPFGICILAVTDKGICYLAFLKDADRSKALDGLKNVWMNANLIEDPEQTEKYIDSIFTPDIRTNQTILLHLRGTNFQLKVWEALLRIPPGHVTSYDSIAKQVGRPGSARAVGNAVSKNPVAYIIPCHRVIRKIGDFGNYRYGIIRKKALLAREMGSLTNN